MRLSFNKIKVSRSSMAKLTVLKRRTGLNPNLVCRIGLCMSLEEPGLPSLEIDEEGSEFNRYTLTGDWDDVFMALLTERLHADGIHTDEEALVYLKAHVNRGVSMVYSRLKSLSDLERIFTRKEEERSAPDEKTSIPRS